MNIYLKFIKVTGMIFLSVAFFVSAMSFDVINTEDLEKEVDGILNKYINISVPGASVSVVKDGEILFSKGYGFSDIENKIPVTPEETVFEYGSINKLFVWVSAMQLAEAGKIDLNENVEKYLPEEVRRNLKYNSSITMLDLMNHTAGFEDTLFDFAQKDLGSLRKLEETVQISQQEQVFTSRE
ncbi:MAG: serine hydrolase, partial [Eubacteriales bacterium]|nr:serine hydrolase [Eubacteriales bacterium]